MKEKTEEIDFVETYDKIKNKFNEYIKKNYDLKNVSIKYKFEHTHRVVEYAEHIAIDLGLDVEEVFVAKLIALFHDFGRFEQIKAYKNMQDHNTMDHGEYAVRVLFKENFIREFFDETKYDSILKEAIYNHNKYEIETKRLSEQQLLHAKIIRDADKTDAFYVKACKDTLKSADYTKEELENSLLSEVVYEEFMDEKSILISDLDTPADRWMFVVAFIFGYNFTTGLKILKEEDFIGKIKKLVEFKNEETINKIKNMYILVENYIDYRISNNINF